MSKKIIYGTIVILLLVIIILTGIFGDREPDWTMSFSRYSKNPYGNILLYDFLKTIFPRKKISTIHDSVYMALNDKKHGRQNYIFINNSCVFNELDGRELLRFVSEGNNAFISANMILNIPGSKFSGDLGIETSPYMGIITGTRVCFVNSRLGRHEYTVKLEGGSFYFSKLDRKKTAILSVNEKNDPVLLRIRYGRGYFYLSSIPLAFTNYNIVSRDGSYPFIALSYLPVYDTLWDEFYKIGRIEAQTPLRFILNSTSLRWAYILTMVLIMLVIISGAKRKQRIIPVIPRPANTSLDFITTVGSLYYQSKDHRNIAQKKINHFFEFIRSHFYMDTREHSNAFCERLALKTGMTPEEIKDIFLSIEDIQLKERITKAELKELNKNIDTVYLKARAS